MAIGLQKANKLQLLKMRDQYQVLQLQWYFRSIVFVLSVYD